MLHCEVRSDMDCDAYFRGVLLFFIRRTFWMDMSHLIGNMKLRDDWLVFNRHSDNEWAILVSYYSSASGQLRCRLQLKGVCE